MPVLTIIDEDAMQTELLKAGGKLVVIDFTATWCGPCKQIGPFFEELSDQYPSTVFLKVDVDDNSEIAMEYQVSAMPTFIFLKKLKEIDRVLGADFKVLENKVHNLSASLFQPLVDNPPALPSRNSNQQQQHQQQPPRKGSSRLLPPGYQVYPVFPPQFQSSGHQAPPTTMTGNGRAGFSTNESTSDQNDLILHSTEVSNGAVSSSSSGPMMDKIDGGKSDTVSVNTNTNTTTVTTNNKERRRKRSSHRTKSSSRRGADSTTTPLSTSKVNKEHETMAQKALKVKKKLPTSVLQIRLADGSKMTATFNTTHTVSKIREFITNARPLYATKSFRLMTFPSREIADEDISLQDANLINAVVVQKLT